MPRTTLITALSICLGLMPWAHQPTSACGPYSEFEQFDGQEEVNQLMVLRAKLAQEHQDLLAQEEADPAELQASQERLARFDAMLDAHAHQYGCAHTGLYWYTDLAEAEAVAQASGKPILSLRMLGNLTEEYSCANSRFFRTTLYANEEIAEKLREGFVLHWESVRPVPMITIDFGDGRVIERTLTGNSAHYVLSPAGQPVDLLPGLYGPAAFLAWLEEAAALSQQFMAADEADRPRLLAEYHAERLAAMEAALHNDLNQVMPLALQPANAVAGAETNASQRLPLAMAATLDEAIWQQIAWLHGEAAQLDEGSVEAIAAQNPTAFAASQIAFSKARVETPLVRMLQNLEYSIALDTVRNEYLLHAEIHRWFAEGSTPPELAHFTDRVYSELFLTPPGDPWLGLVPPDTYTGLEDGGLSVEGVDPRSAAFPFRDALPLE